VVVSYAAWFLGPAAGLTMAALGALAWLSAYFLVGHPFSNPGILVWNVVAEGIVYAAVALALGSLRNAYAHTRGLAKRLQVSNVALDRETRAVGLLQHEMLPLEPPALPGYRWSLHYETSTRSGGDYYDFVALPDGRIGVLIADASGHGAAAAVLMAVTRALFRRAAAEALPPDRLLARLSRELGKLLPAGWFVTACYLVLDPARGGIEYSLAGHDPPLVLRRGAPPERLPALGGPLLGPFVHLPYELGRARLLPGDALLLHTDGLTEAEDPDGRLLGEEALLETLSTPFRREPEAIRDALLERVRRHRAGRAPGDDLTLLVLERTRGVAELHAEREPGLEGTTGGVAISSR
jgi:sigma-B regulation protein RsbU (phosphoserine phosphatase)